MEELIRGEHDKRWSSIKVGASKSLLASLTYMIHSSSSYTSAAWRILRRDVKHDWNLDDLRSTRCCDETGMQRKLTVFLDKNAEMSSDDIDRRAKRPLDTTAKFVMAVNGFSTKEAEQCFSNGRNAGVTLILVQG